MAGEGEGIHGQEDRPAPLVPLGCDLRRGFPHIMLDFREMQATRFWLICKRRPELAFYFMNLSFASWHEVPAASLPNDDDVLADWARCPPERWDLMKADLLTGAGWCLCSDGRWHHPLHAERAIAAWVSMLDDEAEKEAARRRMALLRARGSPHDLVSFAEQVANVRARTRHRIESNRTESLSPESESGPRAREEARQEAGSKGEGDPAAARFEGFWHAWLKPPGDSKSKAREAWLQVASELPGEALLLACVQAFAASIEAENRNRPASDPYRVCHAKTWLLGRRWRDHQASAEAELARRQAVAERRAVQLAAGGPEWARIADAYSVKHGWGTWDAFTHPCRLIAGDVPGIEFPDERTKRFAIEQGMVDRLQRIAGGGLMVSVRVRAVS